MRMETAATILLTAAAAACESPPPEIRLPGGMSFLERDSAGVVVATTLGTRARSPVGWVVDSVPEYQVGEVDGEEPYMFSRIVGARQLADGRVAVLDRSSCELRFFDADGVFLERTGGHGEGPGEFRGGRLALCTLVPSQHPDSLFGWDGANLSVFDDRGRFSRRHRLVWPSGRVRLVAGVADGFVAVGRNRYGPQRGDRLTELYDYAMLEPETRRLAWEKIGLPAQRQYTVPLTMTAIVPMPFDIRPSAAMARDGLYMTLGENQGPEIRQYGAEGHLSRIVRLAEPLGAPTREDIHSLAEFTLAPHEMADSVRAWASQRLRSRYSSLPLPEIIPVFSRLIVDDEGWLWAELYRYEVHAPVRWLVFDPDGEGVGSVDLPPDLDVRQIGRDFILGVWRDELGVQYVRRHALSGRAERRPGSQLTAVRGVGGGAGARSSN